MPSLNKSLMPVALYLGDCLKIMPTLDAESVDSIVTDPPYGLSDKHPQDIIEGVYRALFKIGFPDLKKFDPEFAQNIDLASIALDGSPLSRRRLAGIEPRIFVPKGSVDFNRGVEVGQEEVEASGVPASCGIPNAVLMDEVDSPAGQFLGDYILDLRDAADLAGRDCLGSSAAELGTGFVGVPVVPTFLPGENALLASFLLSHSPGFADAVGGHNFASRQPSGSAGVMAGSGTIQTLMLGFDLSRRSIELLPAGRTSESGAIHQAGRPKLVAASSGTSRLAMMAKPHNVRVVCDGADGAYSAYFRLWLRHDPWPSLKSSIPSGGFMGKGWDHGVPGVEFWIEALRVLKPGGHLLAFGGTRTVHRLTCAIEDAGFEVRDTVMWIYSQGFPKSLSVDKAIDRMEQEKWAKVCKAIDNLDESSIIESWKEHSKTASNADLSFQKSGIATGTNTAKNVFAPVHVALQVNLKNNDANAVLAELGLTEARLTSEETDNTAPINVVEPDWNGHVKSAARQQPSDHRKSSATGIAQCDVKVWLSESTADKLKAVEALTIWLGRTASSKKADTSALCAALTEDLKRITLSRSKTFQSFDTTQQTAFASATTATITESTAASLISFTVATLRNKAMDKAAGATRTVVGPGKYADRGRRTDNAIYTASTESHTETETVPATDAAQQWQGWGTALKPAHEPIIVARKPLIGTVVQNVLQYGTGAINIDGCRVETDDSLNGGAYAKSGTQRADGWGMQTAGAGKFVQPTGRWPANVILDDSEEVRAGFEGKAKNRPGPPGRRKKTGLTMGYHGSDRSVVTPTYDDSGSAARFFYCAKASKADRWINLHCDCQTYTMPASGGESMGECDSSTSLFGSGHTADCLWPASWKKSGCEGCGSKLVETSHPTVKPTELMRWLCRLVTPPNGIILDPFMGSGSTGKAAVLEGFRFAGIEQDASYLKIAQSRLAGG